MSTVRAAEGDVGATRSGGSASTYVLSTRSCCQPFQQSNREATNIALNTEIILTKPLHLVNIH
jgi:hypothetical protein